MFNVKDFSDLLIAQGRTLGTIRYPMFCEIKDNSYDIDKELPLVTAIKRIMCGEYKEIAVLDSFDCAYYGSFDYDDIVNYMLEKEFIHEI